MNATLLTLCFGFVLSCFLLGCVLIYPDLMDPAGMRIGVKKDISLFSLFLHVDFHLTLFLVFMTFLSSFFIFLDIFKFRGFRLCRYGTFPVMLLST